MEKTTLLQNIDGAKICVSNTVVVTQKHAKTIISFKSVTACLILLGHNCNKWTRQSV